MNTPSTQTETKPAPTPIDPENAIEFAVMGTAGDTKHTWDKTKPVEVDAAREMFKKLRDQKYVAYKLNPKDDSKGDQVDQFDAEAGAYIFAPALRGG